MRAAVASFLNLMTSPRTRPPVGAPELRQHDRRRAKVGHARVTADGLLGHLERVLERCRALEPEAVHDVAICPDEDDVTCVLHRMRCPNPRVVRMNAVIGV